MSSTKYKIAYFKKASEIDYKFITNSWKDKPLFIKNISLNISEKILH